jgi:hypothetical protein
LLALKVAYNLVKISPNSKDHAVVIDASIKSASKDHIQGEALEALSDYMEITAKNSLITQVMIQQL